MKSLIALSRQMLNDISISCSTDTQRDYLTIVARVKHEGLSFLTISLGNYGQAFERGLERGYLEPRDFVGFRIRGRCPEFLQGVVALVFDRLSGKLLDVPNKHAILCVRQLCLMFKKIRLPCSDARTKLAFKKYVQCDTELDKMIMRLPDYKLKNFERVAGILWSNMFSKISQDIINLELAPKHGPGKTADRISRNGKFDFPIWHERLNSFMPFEEYVVFNHNFSEYLDHIEVRDPGQEQPVKVVSVPKTLKGPRIIAMEPSCVQFAQQALKDSLTSLIESDEITGGHVNFRDQSVNQVMAWKSSLDARFATLDLSEASDRVSNALVLSMCKSAPVFSEAVQACRSTRAELPDGTIVPLTKFASMGSALCFPIEAMVFFTIIITSELQRRCLPLKRSSIDLISRGVYIYGDDIIIPTDAVPTVCADLEIFGLKVNTHKSFSNGKFRESCGKEYYDGYYVTPTYVRSVFPVSRRDSSEIWSTVSLANQLYMAGFWNSCRFVREYVTNLVGSLPHVTQTSSSLGWHSVDNRYSIQGWHKELQSPLVKTYVLKPKKEGDAITGHSSLMKWATKPNINGDVDHYKKSVRSGDVAMYRRWSTPF